MSLSMATGFFPSKNGVSLCLILKNMCGIHVSVL